MNLNKDTWNPSQYEKFSEQRNQPFSDLLKLITPCPKMKILDLGCGSGYLTRLLHDSLNAEKTLGIDSSFTMLDQCGKFNCDRLKFKQAKIEEYISDNKVDLIFSNAALQWVPNHKQEIMRYSNFLKNEGQLAIQMPANFDYPTHQIAHQLSLLSPFKEYLDNLLFPKVYPLTDYSELLCQLGFHEQQIMMKVYPHFLENTQSIIEWVKGSLFTYFQQKLPQELYQQFCRMYQEQIYSYFGVKTPLFLPFKRILIWGKKS